MDSSINGEMLSICGHQVKVSYGPYDKERKNPILSNDDYNRVSGFNFPPPKQNVAITYRGPSDLMDLMDSNFSIFYATKKQNRFRRFICNHLYENMSSDAKRDADDSVKNYWGRLKLAYFLLGIALLCPFLSLWIGEQITSISTPSLFMRGSTVSLVISLCVEVLVAKYNVGSNDSLFVNQFITLKLSQKHQLCHLAILLIVSLATIMTGFGDVIYHAIYPPYKPTLQIT